MGILSVRGRVPTKSSTTRSVRADKEARATYEKEYTTKSRTTRRARTFGPDEKAYDEELDDDK